MTVTRTKCRANKKARVLARAFRQIHCGPNLLAHGGGAVLLLLADAGRFAAQITQVIELGAAHLAATHHRDRVDHRRHHREYAFHAFAVGNLAHRKTLIEPAAGTADADAFIGLHAGAAAVDHLDADDHGVAWSELRNLLAGGQFFELLFFELLNEVQREISIGSAQAIPARAARTSTILPLRGFGARIRQRQPLVTHPSCFLGVFGRGFWPARGRAAAPASGPRPRPGARPRPGRGRATAGLPGSAG